MWHTLYSRYFLQTSANQSLRWLGPVLARTSCREKNSPGASHAVQFKNCFYASVHPTDWAEGIMFSGCPFVVYRRVVHGLGWPMGWVGLGHTKWTHGQLWCTVYVLAYVLRRMHSPTRLAVTPRSRPLYTSMDAAYCYRCSLVCLSLCWTNLWALLKRTAPLKLRPYALYRYVYYYIIIIIIIIRCCLAFGLEWTQGTT